MDTLPKTVFLGYRTKRPWKPGLAWAPIERVCCVGENLCEPPEGWIDRWDFNRAFCYPTPEAAWITVKEDRAAYRLFAYSLLPLDLYDGEPPVVVPLNEIFVTTLHELPPLGSEPFDMAELGYDIAECKLGFLGYPYSPLVTNGFSHEFAVNRYGLLDELETAIRACEVINSQMPEHAPHWVFRVFAKHVDDSLARECIL